MISLERCRKLEQDAKTAFCWRNDPETIASSYVPLPKTWDSFWLEYEQLYFDVPALAPFFVLRDGEKAGFVRFEETAEKGTGLKDAVEIIINICPQYRHCGVGSAALNLIKEKMRAIGVRVLVADVRRENKASRRLFEKCGFEFLSEREEYISKIQKNCHIFRYRYAL